MKDEDDDEIARQPLPKPPLLVQFHLWRLWKWARSMKGQEYLIQLFDAIWSRLSSPMRQVLGGIVAITVAIDSANWLPLEYDNMLEGIMGSALFLAIVTRSQKKATTLTEAEERLLEAYRKAQELEAQERVKRLDAATGGG